MSVILRTRSILATLLATAPFAACGGSTELGAGVSSTTSAVHVCDGSAGARLAARVGGGGPSEPGREMLAENGWEYLIVTGTCDAWVLPSESQPLRHLTLSSEQERALVRDLRVGRWSALSARTPPAGGCADAGSITYRFDQVHYESPACGLDPADEFALVDAALDPKLQQLAGAGVAADGDVRYLLIEGDASTGLDYAYKNPATWPLGAAPAALAVTRAQTFAQPTAGRSLRASGDDASGLRALRDDFLAGRIGNMMYAGFIPIVAADGMRFELYVRDAAPFEGTDGLIGPGVF
jgi:hypothetical protein